MSRHLRINVLATFAVFGASFGFGCSGKETGEKDAEQLQQSLDKDNGGLNTNSEDPGFGDPQADETVPTSEVGEDEEQSLAAAAVDAPRARLYRLALIWGHMPPARDASDEDPTPTPADFSGSVSLDRGAIGVSRTIRFDDRDHLEPRTALKEVSFVSHTLPNVDGLLLTVRVPDDASPVLHFNTTEMSTDIDLGAIQTNVGGIVRSAGGYNGVSYLGFEDRPGCTSGFIVGRWNKTRPKLGHFHGRVLGDHGAPLGHIKGIWGHARRADKNLFFGKYIDPSGDFRGLFGGTYGDGAFRGIWGTREPREVGGLAGFYSDGYVQDDGRGVFLGRFQEKCPL